MIIPEGKIIAATTGSYSDFCIMGYFKALKTFDIEEEGKRHLSNGGALAEDSFLAYLVANGFVDPADDEVQEVHLDACRQYVNYPESRELRSVINVS